MKFNYVGKELELFRNAENWKRYWISQISNEISLDKPCLFLEVGCGIGGNASQILNQFKIVEELFYVGIDPDESLISICRSNFSSQNIEFRRGYSSDHPLLLSNADVVLYADVFEHLASDENELRFLEQNMKDGAVLVGLVPAHKILFSSFDRSVGHHRRYSKKEIERKLMDHNFTILKLRYLDSFGLFLSLFAKLFSQLPTKKTVKFWDQFVVKASTYADKVFGFNIGKSILFIGRKDVGAPKKT